jgi:cyclic pyranopterin phosphate synthase
MLTDQFQRTISYLRLSVTDRCDFRCVYCMAEDMTFLPRKEILSLEELSEIGAAFVELGGKKIRLTGGEPLIRKDFVKLVESLGALAGLEQLAITTNGSQLSSCANKLAAAGVTSLNVSLDSLDAAKFKTITRTGDLTKVLAGIEAAQAAGIKNIRLNSVILQTYNLDDVAALIDFAIDKRIDIAFIEEMPLGEMPETNRAERWLSNETLVQELRSRYDLHDASTSKSDSGPARYQHISGTNTRIGFISPHSHNFCSTCNRIRVTVEGRLLLCLGNEHSLDLRAILRATDYTRETLKHAIVDALAFKPERHHFYDPEHPQILRFMNATGG